MTWWEYFWFHLLWFLEAPLQMQRSVSIRRKYHHALEEAMRFAKNRVSLHAEDVASLQKMEEQAADADLLLPHAQQVLITLTRTHMQAILEERRKELTKLKLVSEVKETADV